MVTMVATDSTLSFFKHIGMTYAEEENENKLAKALDAGNIIFYEPECYYLMSQKTFTEILDDGPLVSGNIKPEDPDYYIKKGFIRIFRGEAGMEEMLNTPINANSHSTRFLLCL